MKKREKPILTYESKMTLLVLGGIATIYLGTHFTNNYQRAQSVVLPDRSDADHLQIVSLQINSGIVYSNATSDHDVTQTELNSGIVHLKGTANPGDIGNDFMVMGPKFADAASIKDGDQIVVTHDLKHYTYVVYETRTVEATELWITSQITDGQKIVTLETAAPGSKTKQKFIAIARLKN